MLSHARLSNVFWAEAISTACYIANRIQTSAVKDGKTPFERWYERKPNLSHLKVFGCMAFVHVPDVQCHKSDKKAEKLRFVGYSTETKGYRMFDDRSKKIVIRRDVVFNEPDFGHSTLGDLKKDSDETQVSLDSEEEENPVHVQEPQRLVQNRAPPIRYGFEEFADIMTASSEVHYAYAGCHVPEPRTMDEAMSGDNAKEWKAAADSEYQSLLQNDTWELVKLPENRKSIAYKWVFKVKYGSNGQVERFKSRLVAKGYAQKYGIDYDETFSPVVRFTSIRALLAVAVQNKMLIHQMDVETAFLNGKLDQELYMEQPEGYIKPSEEHLVYELERSLY